MHAIEFHGRLCRADGRPANPGVYELQFRLHPGREGEATIWEEVVHEVPVAPGGYYHTVLGLTHALRPVLFDGHPRWLSVRVLRDGRVGEEVSERIPVLGQSVQAADRHGQLEARVAAIEGRKDGSDPLIRKRLRVLKRHVRRLLAGEGPYVALAARLDAIEQRLVRIDGEEGRIVRIEDELDDLVGPDGDLVDLNERMDVVEGLRAAGTTDRLGQLEARVAAIEARIPVRKSAH